MSLSRIHGIFANLPLFREIGEAKIQRIAKGTREVRIAKGETLFQKGDPANGFYIVVYGRVKLAFSSLQGVEKVVHLIGPGNSFGEAVMFLNKPYPVYAQTLEDSLLLHVEKEVLFHEIDIDPGFARKMLAGLSARLHSLIGDVESYSLRSSTQRVIGYLLQQESETPHPNGEIHISLPASKMVIASRLNITPETFSRILHNLTEADLITVDGKSVRIPDIGKLRVYDQ